MEKINFYNNKNINTNNNREGAFLLNKNFFENAKKYSKPQKKVNLFDQKKVTNLFETKKSFSLNLNESKSQNFNHNNLQKDLVIKVADKFLKNDLTSASDNNFKIEKPIFQKIKTNFVVGNTNTRSYF